MALVFLDRELRGPYLRVPAVDMARLAIPNNHPLALVGYYSKKGTTRREALKESFLPYQSRETCEQKYRAHRIPYVPNYGFRCAGGFGYKVCNDDVGSPLVVKGATPEEDFAVGILSDATTGSCWMDVPLPSLFTSFVGFQEGIDKITSGDPLLHLHCCCSCSTLQPCIEKKRTLSFLSWLQSGLNGWLTVCPHMAAPPPPPPS